MRTALIMCIVFTCPLSWALEEMRRAKDTRRASLEKLQLETSESYDPLALLYYCPLSTLCTTLLFTGLSGLLRLLGQHVGETAESPLLDPCLPTDLQDEIGPSTQKLYLRGTGDFDQCRLILQPFLNRTNATQTSISGVYQPVIDYNNSQFYGFSEFYYCTEDVLRMGGDYNASKYTQAAKVNTTYNIHKRS